VHILSHSYFGRVDSVPGLFHVETRFLHIWWFPVIPLDSHVFLDARYSFHGHRRQRIPMRWKSVWVAWSRAFSLLAVFALICAGAMCLALEPSDARLHPGVLAIWTWSLALLAGGFYWWSYSWESASLTRALNLAERVGLAPEEVKTHFPHELQQGGEEKTPKADIDQW
jgi:hypothetical protein